MQQLFNELIDRSSRMTGRSSVIKYNRFEDLPVWKSAIDLAERIYRLTRNRLFSQSGDLRDQLRRAALSVSNNVAEGFERGTTAELLMFLYIARGSAGEVRSMLHFCERLASGASALTSGRTRPGGQSGRSDILNLKSEISDLKSEIAALIVLSESCSRQLRGWADSLQNSDIQGQRHLNDKSRAGYEQRQRAEAFRQLIDQKFREAHPELFAGPDASSQP